MAAILFEFANIWLAVVVLVVIFGSIALGTMVGRRKRHQSDDLKESYGVLQGALLGVVGLLLAFGLSLALSRYEDRRAGLVLEANAIGTTWLRAQTLPEPERSESLDLLIDYTEQAIVVADTRPGSDDQAVATDAESELQRDLWALAAESLDDRPRDSAPKLYVETLNEMIDSQTVRTAGLNNRVPSAVLILELLGAALALGLLAAHLALMGRGIAGVLVSGIVVAFLLFVTADLDRPTRGLIEVPDTVLRDQLESMELPPAAGPPT